MTDGFSLSGITTAQRNAMIWAYQVDGSFTMAEFKECWNVRTLFALQNKRIVLLNVSTGHYYFNPDHAVEIRVQLEAWGVTLRDYAEDFGEWFDSHLETARKPDPLPEPPIDPEDTPILSMQPITDDDTTPPDDYIDAEDFERQREEEAERSFRYWNYGSYGGGGGGGEEKRVLVPQLDVMSSQLRRGFVFFYVDMPIETLIKLCPEIGERKRALIHGLGMNTDIFVSFRVAIYDIDEHDESTMYSLLDASADEVGGGGDPLGWMTHFRPDPAKVKADYKAGYLLVRRLAFSGWSKEDAIRFAGKYLSPSNAFLDGMRSFVFKDYRNNVRYTNWYHWQNPATLEKWESHPSNQIPF